MCPLLETIKCADGKLFNMEYHQIRFDIAQKEYFKVSPKINLSEKIVIPEYAESGLFRCRVTYAEQISSIEFFPYQFRKINSLKLVEDNEIDYRYKYSDREKLNKLFEKRDNCDDIIIIKNRCITDSFVANLIFFDGVKWWTPNTPLLPGTQRAKLIQEGKIFENRITTEDLSKYQKVGLINALNSLDEMQIVSTEYICY